MKNNDAVVAGFVWSVACNLLDEGKDPREFEIPELLNKIDAAFGLDGEEIWCEDCLWEGNESELIRSRCPKCNSLSIIKR